jgi:hypothetical protein
MGKPSGRPSLVSLFLNFLRGISVGYGLPFFLLPRAWFAVIRWRRSSVSSGIHFLGDVTRRPLMSYGYSFLVISTGDPFPIALEVWVYKLSRHLSLAAVVKSF